MLGKYLHTLILLESVCVCLHVVCMSDCSLGDEEEKVEASVEAFIDSLTSLVFASMTGDLEVRGRHRMQNISQESLVKKKTY